MKMLTWYDYTKGQVRFEEVSTAKHWVMVPIFWALARLRRFAKAAEFGYAQLVYAFEPGITVEGKTADGRCYGYVIDLTTKREAEAKKEIAEVLSGEVPVIGTCNVPMPRRKTWVEKLWRGEHGQDLRTFNQWLKEPVDPHPAPEANGKKCCGGHGVDGA